MDSDAALKTLRDAVARWQSSPNTAVGNEMAEAAATLDGWLSKQGFLPRAWQR